MHIISFFNSHFSETLAGTCSIRAYQVKDRFTCESSYRIDNNQVFTYANGVSFCWLSVRLEFLASVLIFFAALFAVLARETLEPGAVGLSLSYAINLTMMLNYWVKMTADLETNIVAVERVMEYTKIEPEAEWTKQEAAPDEKWPAEGNIEFINYATKYREGLDLVLKGIDVKINKGEKVTYYIV